MNINLFALVSTSILKLTPILFFIKVHRTIRRGPLISLVKLTLLISNVNNPREETFPRPLLFLTYYLYNLLHLSCCY